MSITLSPGDGWPVGYFRINRCWDDVPATYGVIPGCGPGASHGYPGTVPGISVAVSRKPRNVVNKVVCAGEDLCDAKWVAVRLNTTLSTVYDWAESGELPCIRRGKGWLRFRPSAIEEWINNHEVSRRLDVGRINPGGLN